MSKFKQSLSSITMFSLIMLVAYYFVTSSKSVVEEITKPGKEAGIKKLRVLLSKPIKEIIIHQEVLSSNEFNYVLADENNIKIFKESALLADTKSINSPSGTVFEGIIIVKAEKEELKYRASVMSNEQESLYLSTHLWKKNKDGSYSATPGTQFRVPNLGEWIAKVAPKGMQ